MKYIIVKAGICELETPILFPDTMGHNEIANKLGLPVVSAGFCVAQFNGNFYCYGQSVSLGIKSRDEDTEVLNRMFLM